MKKLGMLALAAVMVVMFTIPAWAIESEFGGYWRTRMYTNQNFTGEDETEARDFTGVDTRTRLFYTAIFHENLKFVNKFEFDTTWGSGTLGDIGADGKEFEIKNSYIDANTGPVNWKVGIQGARLARGFLFDDDFSGMQINYKGDTFEVPFIWVKAFEGTNLNGTNEQDANDLDMDYFGLFPKFSLGEVSLNPYLLYVYSKDASAAQDRYGYPEIIADIDLFNLDEVNTWFVGFDADATFDMLTLWFTGIYQGGEVDVKFGENSADISAWLAAIGGSFNLGVFDIHGQGFYASGDDDFTDDDWEQFTPPPGRSYYWAEIMGFGIFDFQASANAPADNIRNVWAANLGTTIKPMDKLKVTLDVWYASLVENDVLEGDDELGTEVDLIITYEIVQNLNLDLVGAYLFAGDATTRSAADLGIDDADPYEIGARLSLSF
jgi:hypothetical protein